MTLDEAVELANRVASESAHRISVDDAKRLARFVRDTLGAPVDDDDEEAPSIVSDAITGERSVFYDGITYDRSGALAVGAAFIRAALALPEGK